jgi:hypothetical protein
MAAPSHWHDCCAVQAAQAVGCAADGTQFAELDAHNLAKARVFIKPN